jgi:hypothetical protein
VPKAQAEKQSGLDEEYVTRNLHGGSFFIDCMNNQGNLPTNLRNSRRTSDARLVLSAYKAMATEEERKLLIANPDKGTAQRIARDVGKLLMARIVESYREQEIEAPPRFLSSSFLFQTAVDQLKRSKVVVDSLAFRQWRKQHASSSSSGEASSSSSGEKRAAPEPAAEAAPLRKSPRPLGAPAVEVDSDSGDSPPEDDLFGSDAEAAEPEVVDLGSDSE